MPESRIENIKTDQEAESNDEEMPKKELSSIFNLEGENELLIKLENPGEYRINVAIGKQRDMQVQAVLKRYADDINATDNPVVSYTVESMKIGVGEKEITLDDLKPDTKDTSLAFLAHKEPHKGTYAWDGDYIAMGSFSQMNDIITLLHEIGHAVDYKKNPYKKSEGALFHWETGEYQSEPVKHKGKRERNAWAEATKIAKRTGLPIKDMIKEQSEKSLSTYDSMAKQLGGDIDVEHFSSRSSRKRRRQVNKIKI